MVFDFEKRARQFEDQTKNLELDLSTRQKCQESVDALINQFIDSLLELSTFSAPQDDILRKFESQIKDLPIEVSSLKPLLSTLHTFMSQSGILAAGPGHFGFIPGGGLYVGAIADHFAASINAFTADAYSSPVAVHVHEEVLRWLCHVVGYQKHSWGDITSGGSQATLTAFYTARQARNLHPKDFDRVCVYLSEHTHHCSEKALRVLFGQYISIRKVPLKRHVLDPTALETMIQKDLEQEKLPWMIIATAGTTNLGMADDFQSLSKIAKKFSLWLHVDGAYGGFFKLCPEKKELFEGLDQADSIVLDPHKGMFLPYGCGAVLIKNGEFLHNALNQEATYLQDCEQDKQKSPMHYSLELSRPFRSLRIWMALKLYGEQMFQHALSEKLLLADYCYEKLSRVPVLKIIEKNDLSILGFRYEHPQRTEQCDQDTRDLLKRINMHPEVFLSSTVIDDHFVIRIAVLSFRTHFLQIEKLIQIICSETEKISQF